MNNTFSLQKILLDSKKYKYVKLIVYLGNLFNIL